MAYLLLAAGLGLLVLGADILVRGGVGLANRLGVSPLLIGVTIVAYGTSAPELVVSVNAALAGSPGIAVGNVIGSNIFNILLILGATAIIAPIAVSPRAIYRDGSFALFAAVLFIAIALVFGQILLWHGLIMLGIIVAMVVYTYRQERVAPDEPSADLHRREGEQVPVPSDAAWISVALVVAGIGVLILGSNLLVDSAVTIARTYGVSETVIGLTLVAAGTSLPELATSLVAAFKRQADVALGNVIGSNIYNIMIILGAASLITPITIPEEIIRTDMWLMLAATLLVLPSVWLGYRIGRLYGLVLLAGYVGYVSWLFTNAT